MRKMYEDKKDVYKVPNYMPIIFLILSGIVIAILTIYKPLYTVPGFLVTLLGLPIYKLWKTKGKKCH